MSFISIIILPLIKLINNTEEKKLKETYLENVRGLLELDELTFGKKLCLVLNRPPATRCNLCFKFFKTTYMCIQHQIVHHDIRIPGKNNNFVIKILHAF